MKPMSTEELRSVQLATLEAFDSFCESSGLNYQLTYGTLLGAVRHQGYIPWDDDIDVMMPRHHYETMVASFNQATTSHKVSSIAIDRNWPLPFAKIWDTSTVTDDDSLVPLVAGAGIDVWPIDTFPKTRFGTVLHSFVASLLISVETVASVRPRTDHTRTKRTLLRLAGPVARCLGHTRIARLRTAIATLPARLHGSSDQAGISVGSYVWHVPSANLQTTTPLPFMSAMRPAPSGWQATLERMYGDDYMKLPPMDQRVSHHMSSARRISESPS